MIFLLLSIVSSSLIFVFFKWVAKLQMNTIVVIVLNYFFAGMLGWALTGADFWQKVFAAPWLIPAVMLGSLFIGMFYLMAMTTHRSGAAPAVVANKMSVVIPISVAFIFLNEEITGLKLSGILLALVGIYLVTKKASDSAKWGRNFWMLLLLFAGSGLIDTSIKLIEALFLRESDIILFTSVLFFVAFTFGLIVLSFRIKKHVSTFRAQKLYMALGLGLVNFGSIYFLVQALMTKGLESSVLFPLNNIGVVVLSTVLSILLFKEKLSKINLSGVVLSVIALVILMIAT